MAPPKMNLRSKVVDNELDLSLSELTEVPVKEIASIRKVTRLDLSNNSIVTLGPSFPSLYWLITLDLSKNRIVELPENFGDLVGLQHLDLYSNKIERLPLSFYQLVNLRWLDLKDNPLVQQVRDKAGDCLSPEECRKCARQVVQFMKAVKRTVDQEKERRRLVGISSRKEIEGDRDDSDVRETVPKLTVKSSEANRANKMDTQKQGKQGLEGKGAKASKKKKAKGNQQPTKKLQMATPVYSEKKSKHIYLDDDPPFSWSRWGLWVFFFVTLMWLVLHFLEWNFTLKFCRTAKADLEVFSKYVAGVARSRFWIVWKYAEPAVLHSTETVHSWVEIAKEKIRQWSDN